MPHFTWIVLKIFIMNCKCCSFLIKASDICLHETGVATVFIIHLVCDCNLEVVYMCAWLYDGCAGCGCLSMQKCVSLLVCLDVCRC